KDTPWLRIPPTHPFVLPEDEPAVTAFNLQAIRRPNRLLHLEILPEVFVGDRAAPVVLLGNNPGFNKAALHSKQDPKFMKRMRDNLHHLPSTDGYPFVFLAPDFNGPGKKWWKDKLGDLPSLFGDRVLANSIFAVEYFP